MPEVIAAADLLARRGVTAGNCVPDEPGPGLPLLQQRGRREAGTGSNIIDELFPPGAPRPIVTALDGHPHTLAFLAGARGDRILCLGVTEFGQSSDLADAYHLHGIDTGSIADAALTLVGS